MDNLSNFWLSDEFFGERADTKRFAGKLRKNPV